jgi:hypothetical protein
MYAIAVGFSCQRAPNDFAVSIAYCAIPCRIIQVFGWYCNKKLVTAFGLGMSIFVNVLLMMNALVYDPYSE